MIAEVRILITSCIRRRVENQRVNIEERAKKERKQRIERYGTRLEWKYPPVGSPNHMSSVTTLSKLSQVLCPRLNKGAYNAAPPTKSNILNNHLASISDFSGPSLSPMAKTLRTTGLPPWTSDQVHYFF